MLKQTLLKLVLQLLKNKDIINRKNSGLELTNYVLVLLLELLRVSY